MAVPSSIDDLSTTAGSNSPGGSETPGQGDDHLRAAYSFIAILRDKLDGTSDTGTITNATFSPALRSPITAYKPATTSRASTAVLADDPHLVVALTAGVWLLDGFIGLAEDAVGADGGLKAAFAFTGTATGYWAAVGHAAGGVNINSLGVALGTSNTLVNTTFNPLSSPTDWARLSGYVSVTVAGNLKLQWSQENSVSNGTNIIIGSWLSCTKVS